MPCYDAQHEEDKQRALKELPKVEAMLCSVLRVHAYYESLPQLLSVINYEKAGVTAKEILDWFVAHCAKDAILEKETKLVLSQDC